RTPSPRGRCGRRATEAAPSPHTIRPGRNRDRQPDPPPSSRRDSHVTTAPSPDWFTLMRFGLFVHFGLYSTLARHEWVMTNERTAPEEYEKNARYFDPDRFDAADIARTARA